MNNKKIALICGAALKDAPYVSYYTDFFKGEGIPFDLYFWNRNGDDYSYIPDNYTQYDKSSSLYSNPLKKLFDAYFYARFVKKHLKKEKYCGYVCFGIITPFFLCRFLMGSHKHYIVDIRDYSPYLKIKIISKRIDALIRKSYTTCISSPGFRRWLAESNKYMVFHNCGFNYFESYDRCRERFGKKIEILTIGQIRDYESNTILIKDLANKSDFCLKFSGKGAHSLNIAKYAEDNHVYNFEYTGAYKKEEEQSIAMQCDMINSVFMHDVNSDSLLTNRLYLALKNGKPLIVSENCFQADIVNTYHLGAIIDMKKNIFDQLTYYCQSFDINQYNKGQSDFIDTVKADIEGIKNKLKCFYSDCIKS